MGNGNPREKEADLKVEFSLVELEEVLHEEITFFFKARSSPY
jgi:hypothetical protein